MIHKVRCNQTSHYDNLYVNIGMLSVCQGKDASVTKKIPYYLTILLSSFILLFFISKQCWYFASGGGVHDQNSAGSLQVGVERITRESSLDKEKPEHLPSLTNLCWAVWVLSGKQQNL